MDKKAITEEVKFLINKLKTSPLATDEIEKISQFEVEMLLKISEKLYLQLTILDYIMSSKLATPEKEEAVSKFKAVFEETAKVINEEPAKSSEPVKPQVDLFGGEAPVSSEKAKVEKKPVAKEEKTTSKSIQKPKIDDLTTAIGLNDKFQFANELFVGNMSEYAVAINQLNTAGTIESAMEYVESLQQLYEWDFENETLKRLLELVDRRYSL